MLPNSSETALVERPADEQERQLSTDPLHTALAVAGMDDNSFYCSRKPAGEDDIAAIHKALNGATHALSDMLGKTIEVSDVLLHRVEVLDTATREPKTLTRMVLISTDGASYGCCSSGALKSMISLFQIAGVPPWTPGKMLKVQAVKTKAGRTMYNFEYMPPKGRPIRATPAA